MEGVRHAIGTRVRVNEKPDPRNGWEGEVIERMDDGVRTPFRTLVRFPYHRDFTATTRWYADANLERIDDGQEGG